MSRSSVPVTKYSTPTRKKSLATRALGCGGRLLALLLFLCRPRCQLVPSNCPICRCSPLLRRRRGAQCRLHGGRWGVLWCQRRPRRCRLPSVATLGGAIFSCRIGMTWLVRRVGPPRLLSKCMCGPRRRLVILRLHGCRTASWRYR